MFRRLNRRERLVVAGGAAVSLIALAYAFVLRPEMRRWSEREEQIALRSEQLGRLQAVIDAEEAIRRDLEAKEVGQRSSGQRLLTGATPAVAGSNLQLLLNRYAAESGVEIQRVDAVGQGSGAGPLHRIPARLTVRGDVRGLVQLLIRLRDGDPLLGVDELRVGTTPGLRGDVDLLTISVSLHGYYRETGSGE